MGRDSADNKVAENEAPAIREFSDHDLIEATRNGDESAYGEIVSRYKNPLVSYLYRMLNDYEEAVDLTQEAFVRVYFAIDRYHSDYAFSTYIYRIATNLAISELRKRKRRRLLSLTGFFKSDTEESADLQPPDSRPGPEESLAKGELSRTIANAISALPEIYRAPIILREVEELSYEEISDILDLGLGTTKSRISRGRGMLRQKLESYLEPTNDELF